MFFSFLSLSFYNFMDAFTVTADKCFLLCTTPAFDSMFPLKSFCTRSRSNTPNQTYWTAAECVRPRMRARLMLKYPTI